MFVSGNRLDGFAETLSVKVPVFSAADACEDVNGENGTDISGEEAAVVRISPPKIKLKRREFFIQSPLWSGHVEHGRAETTNCAPRCNCPVRLNPRKPRCTTRLSHKESSVDALKALMLRSLDYAGVFPPAQLPMNDAVKEFVRCRQDKNEWFLARFVLPVARIGEFVQLAGAELAEAAAVHQPWNLTGLIRSGASIDEALAVLRSDAKLLRGLIDTHPDALTVDSCELPLPEEVINSHDQEIARGFFAAALKIFDENNFHGPVFWEVNLKKSFEHVALAAHHANLLQAGRVCLKFRTGGLTAASIVSPENLARAFKVARDGHVPFKLTAGLHLGMRHYDSSVGADLFGFINVFAAAVLSATHSLSETEIQLMLEEKDSAAFVFASGKLSWKNYEAGVTEIRNARTSGLRSFGSCSFFEPIEDMKKLKLLN